MATTRQQQSDLAAFRIDPTEHLPGDAVELLEPHAYACLWSGTPPRRKMHKPVFCDRWCWLEWMRASDE